jgi:hypothetical protein
LLPYQRGDIIYGKRLTDFENDGKNLQTSLALVRKGTILTERPPLVGEVSINFCG